MCSHPHTLHSNCIEPASILCCTTLSIFWGIFVYLETEFNFLHSHRTVVLFIYFTVSVSWNSFFLFLYYIINSNHFSLFTLILHLVLTIQTSFICFYLLLSRLQSELMALMVSFFLMNFFMVIRNLYKPFLVFLTFRWVGILGYLLSLRKTTYSAGKVQS